MFEKNIFSKGVFPNETNEIKTDLNSKEQKENAYGFAQKIRKDMLEKILQGKSPEEKEMIIEAMIRNLQEDLAAISNTDEKGNKAA